MMKRMLVLCCALALSLPALAQVPAALDPAVAKNVRELLTQMKYRELLTARLQQTVQAMPQLLVRAQADRINANKSLSEEQKKAELAIVANDIQRTVQAGQRALSDPKLVDDLIDRVVPLYARRLTAAEVDTLLAFYKSPVAAKMQALGPQIMQETNQLLQEAVKERLTAVAGTRGPQRK
jgi:hypothetical protein